MKPKDDMLKKFEANIAEESRLRKKLGLSGSTVTVEMMRFFEGLVDRIAKLEEGK